MDYIQEELLRQKRALTVLMSGKTREQEDAEHEESGVTSGSELVWQALAGGKRKQIVPGNNLERTERLPVQELKRSAEYGTAVMESGGMVISGYGGTRASETDVMRVPGYIVPYERSADGSAANVRAVSRSIQRDARRYDGGFSIY